MAIMEIWRYLLYAALCLIALRRIQRSRIKRKRAVAVISALLILGLISLSAGFPVENLFVHFPTAESALRYSEHSKLLGTVEGSDSCMVIYQNSAGAFCTFVFPRTEQGYQLPTAGKLKTGKLERSDLGDFNVVQYSGSSDQYVDGFLYDENTNPEEVVGRSLDSVILIPSGVGIASFYALLSPSENPVSMSGYGVCV